MLDPVRSRVQLVELRGDYDMARSGELVQALVDRTSARSIVADLAGVTFGDASMLRALLESGRRLTREGRRLTLANPSARFTMLLQAAGLAVAMAAR